MKRTLDVDRQKSFPVMQTEFMSQMACFGRRSTQIEDSERLLVDWERDKFYHFNSILSSSFAILVFVKWAFVWYHDFFSISARRIRQPEILELSSFLPFRAYFQSEFFEMLSLP